MKNTMLLFILLSSIHLIAQTSQRSYGNDDVQIIQGPYSLLSQQNGVSIFIAWVNTGNNVSAACIKVINNNNTAVIVTWTGPQWISNGSPITHGSQFGYSDKFAPGETKEGIYHKPGSNNGAEVYRFRPNWLYYSPPDNNLIRGQTSIELMNIEVLGPTGGPLRR